jgi:cyanate lyase
MQTMAPELLQNRKNSGLSFVLLARLVGHEAQMSEFVSCLCYGAVSMRAAWRSVDDELERALK